jgi:two-component system cell cycle sensor histidine kinase/response regulator CckA
MACRAARQAEKITVGSGPPLPGLEHRVRATPTPTARAALRTNDEASGRQVLVVDDEPSVRRIMARLLHEAGYSIHEAKDGLEALELVHSAPELLDLVVSDIVMPRLDGVSLVQRLAAVCAELPCILVSGYGTSQLEALGIAAPCGILTKPVPPEVLLDEVRRCLRQRN